MSVTSGFFNSIDGDRKYSAEQMSAIFDGLINDGVYASIGTAFIVKPNVGNTVLVGKGRAWFDSTWIYNDAPLPIDLDISDLLLDRYDAIVLEVSHNDAIRAGSIKVLKGEPSGTPVYPELVNTLDTHQYPLAYVHRIANSSTVTNADIINMVGLEQTPFVTGIIQTVSITEILGRWQDELDQFVAKETEDFNAWYSEMIYFLEDTENELTAWISNEKEKFTTWSESTEKDMSDWVSNEELKFTNWCNAKQTEMNKWTTAKEEEFVTWSENEKTVELAWFEHMKNQLSTDAAVNLQMQIDSLSQSTTSELGELKTNLESKISEVEDTLQTELSESEIERILMIGFLDGTKTFSEDGLTITSVDSKERKMVKTISEDCLLFTTVLTDKNETVLGRLVKEFSSDFSSVTSTFTLGNSQ